jgi:uncharacterized lipoprotein YmbA
MIKKTILLVVFLGGCGSQPLERHEYLLRPERGAEPAPTAEVVRLSKVGIASYLDQDGIVLQTSSTEIHSGRQHKWAEPLDKAIHRYLQVAISNQADVVVEVAPLTTSEPKSEIQVRIHQLHGSTDGDVRLVAEWAVSSEGTEQIHQFDRSMEQSEDGYAALVDTHRALLDEFAVAIAEGLE